MNLNLSLNNFVEEKIEINETQLIKRCVEVEQTYNNFLDKRLVFKEWAEMYGYLSQEEIDFVKDCYK
jgi:hypothetical protein